MANKIDYRLDENGLAHLWQRIKLLVTNKVSNKVDKVDGKGLSTNDYTNAEKTKLAGIESGAQKNVQPDWALTSGDGAIKNKPTIPTNVSDLTNDMKYQSASQVDTKIISMLDTLDLANENISTTLDEGQYFISALEQVNGLVRAKKANFATQFTVNLEAAQSQGDVVTLQQLSQSIANAVGKITSFEYKIVDSLPSTSEGKKGTIYLVAHSGSTNQNSYDEYIFLPAEGSTAARYEKIGTTDIDLTPYAKKTDIPKKVSQLTNDSDFETKTNVGSRITTAINNLDKTDTAVEGKYVSAVSETNGVITVTRANFADAIPAITETQIDNICTFQLGGDLMATDMDRVDSTGLGILWNKMKQYVQQYVQQNSSGGVSISSVYPIGSIYMSVNSTDPSTLFGGSWERIQDRFLLASGNSYGAGSTGGSAKATLPSHTHTFGSNGYDLWVAKRGKGSTEPGNQISGDAKYYASAKGGSTANYKWLSSVDSKGVSDVSQANMPPYLAVYVWQRLS